jgi:hypothetical protein
MKASDITEYDKPLMGVGVGPPPAGHHVSHENGGADEVSVAGLSGLLADDQNPTAHHGDHENGGGDEISLVGLSGLLADAQTPKAHNLIDTTGHPAAGLTAGHFLKATAATTYAFGAHGLSAGDVGAAPAAEGVTNGNAHDHVGGDGNQINHTGLSNIGTLTHAQIDALLPATKTLSITYIIDGGGSVITTGVKGFLEIPFACTLTAYTIMADVSGSIMIDIWRDSYANFPPTDADAMPGAGKEPTLAAAQASQDLNIADWTTVAVSAGDILAFNVDSVATVTRVTLALRATKT